MSQQHPYRPASHGMQGDLESSGQSETMRFHGQMPQAHYQQIHSSQHSPASPGEIREHPASGFSNPPRSEPMSRDHDARGHFIEYTDFFADQQPNPAMNYRPNSEGDGSYAHQPAQMVHCRVSNSDPAHNQRPWAIERWVPMYDQPMQVYPSSYIHPYSYDGDDTGPQARIEDEYLEFPEDQSPHQVLNEQFASHRQAYQGQSLAHQVHWETEQKMPQAMINSQPNQGSFSSPQIEDRDVPVTSQDNKQGYKITDQTHETAPEGSSAPPPRSLAPKPALNRRVAKTRTNQMVAQPRPPFQSTASVVSQRPQASPTPAQASPTTINPRIIELEHSIASLEAELCGQDPAKIVGNHIDLLHRYNEAKDTTQFLIGKLAMLNRTTVVALHLEFDLPLKDL